MIDLASKNHCICKDYGNTQEECINKYTIREKGKSVKCEPRTGEKVTAIIIDKCVITDNVTKCDALFLYQNEREIKYTFLVELKGAGEIEKAFSQLSYTRDKREEYKRIIEDFGALRQNQRFAIVSNGMLPKPRLDALENQYKIRVKKVLHCEATTPIPDLKELI